MIFQKAEYMARKEFINLMEENGMMLERLLSKIHQYPSQNIGYSRQQLMVLVDLSVYGKLKLKEVAHHQCMPTPNLCIMFRKLEAEGLVSRMVDDQDRRNTWYCITPKGTKVANRFRAAVLDTIEDLCHGLTDAEEKKLTQCLVGLNAILKRVEEQNA